MSHLRSTGRVGIARLFWYHDAECVTSCNRGPQESVAITPSSVARPRACRGKGAPAARRMRLQGEQLAGRRHRPTEHAAPEHDVVTVVNPRTTGGEADASADPQLHVLCPGAGCRRARIHEAKYPGGARQRSELEPAAVVGPQIREMLPFATREIHVLEHLQRDCGPGIPCRICKVAFERDWFAVTRLRLSNQHPANPRAFPVRALDADRLRLADCDCGR